MFVQSIFNSETGGIDTGDIPASLRFRSGSYLTRTPGSSDSRRLITLSMWVKRCALGVFQRTFGADDIGSTTFCVGFNTNNKLEIRDYSGSYLIQGISTQVFRDTTSWIHVVVAFDTNQTTFANAVKAYVNGVQISAWDTSTYSGAHDMQINDTRKQSFGVYLAGGAPTTPYDYGLDYLARPCLVTGVQLTPSSFGYLNTEINEWVTKTAAQVKAVVDAGGTNSFMLDFDDATSLTTLGYDKSSKGNNATLNNFSLTAGTSYDRMLDVPGNSFCTWNSVNKGSVPTLSNGNLTWTDSGAGNHETAATFAVTTGKWIWEDTVAGNSTVCGFANASGSFTTAGLQGTCFAAYSTYNGTKYIGTVNSSYDPSGACAAGTVLRHEIDLDSGSYKVFRDGVDKGVLHSWTPGTVSLVPYTGYATTSAGSDNANFGQAPLHASATYHSAAGGYFRDAPTAGYKALCQRNMPDPAILNPEKHFNVVTQLGSAVNTGANLLAQFTDFTADLAWGKDRAAVNNHQLVDTVRGSTAVLQSNTTAAETTYTAPTSGDNCVAWGWKAGGAAVTNNAGSISSQVSANVTAGFSIVTYTGTGANATVGHGLGKAPGLVICKQRNGSTYGWTSWCKPVVDAFGASAVIELQSTSAWFNRATSFNSTAPTSTVFSLGTDVGTNGSTNTQVAYCFAEIPGFSKIFSYTGNGSADGPFVHCGFKPKFILVKRTDSSTYGNWEIIDTVRDTYNQSFNDLIANLSNAENVDGAQWDILSNGFKCRDGSSTGNKNVSGATYIGIAFADVPAKYSLAR